MKKILFSLVSAISLSAMAQNPYLNNTVINTSDLFGTSRFVSMGGAMGALGANISAISSNPAGLGMITKNEASLTAGASWMANNSAKGMASSTFAQFSQVGAVATFNGSGMLRNINFGFNYQKKADFNNSFFGETYTAASWADQLFDLSWEAYDYRTSIYADPDNYYNTLYALADQYGLFCDNIAKTPNDPNSTLVVSRGSLNAYDFNISMNLDNRYFFGITLGLDNLDYRCGTDYWEQRTDAKGNIQDFGYINEQVITGTGFNLKFGAIVRPFESGSFRIGFTVETPTWYNLQYVDDQSLSTKYYWSKNDKAAVYDPTPGAYYTHYVYDLSDSYINYLEYHITSPWKVRAQMGSTLSTSFAWGMEYEYANYSGTTTRYPSQYGGTVVDYDFKYVSSAMFLPQHTMRAGVEYKPASSLALRAGYNYITAITSSASYWDPYFSDNAVAYPTGLDYMNLSDTHIATIGLGYRHKWFYADLAYKYRYQTGTYYAFYSTIPGTGFNVDLSTHTITTTLGVRF